MNVALRRTMGFPEFLAWEERQERRYEFDGFHPVAMTGGTAGHDRITFKLHMALDRRLQGRACQPFGPKMKILAAGRVRYPDALVTCSPVPPNAKLADNPVVVFEVVSEDNQRTDRIEKVQEYGATPSIQHYIILEQQYIGATVFARRGEDWIATALGEGDTLDLPELGIELPLGECYAGLDLPQQAAEEET